ncbi:NAD-glutamate dehydrogenase [Skermania piniformis]|uniref:NAD-glutamate dehydrogenase n=1 Tax=Skermania pinensis TaxID=39122 RepID=A0ABX8SAJ6_9ACTN|nr:NAD-glutamate dehydrogenase [Skermania piniformis]QXQ14888.1 NAD-glutamate dehydrogenase [Skermania piniformis]
MTVSTELSETDWDTIPAELRADIGTVADVYFREVDDRDEIGVAAGAVLRAHLELALVRPAGVALCRVHRPEDGTGLGASVQIVTDDMPMLVESVTATLVRLGVAVDEVVHPVVDVRRDAARRLQHVAPHDVDGAGAAAESWMHLQLRRSTSAELLDRIGTVLPGVLADVGRVVADATAMRDLERSAAAELERNAAAELERSADSSADLPGPALSAAAIEEGALLLRWFADGHCTVLGYCRVDGLGESSRLDESSRLGILRNAGFAPPGFTGARVLELAEGVDPARLRRSVDPYFVQVARFDATGRLIGAHVFLGVFTVSALHDNVLGVPVVGRRVRAVIDRAGHELDSFTGQAMLAVMQSFPRAELFAASVDTLFGITTAVLDAGRRREVLLFLRAATPRRVSCLVYLPRDRWATAVRRRMQDILLREFGGDRIDYSVRVSEADLATVAFAVDRADATPADLSEENRLRVQELLAETSRSWDDRLAEEMRLPNRQIGDLEPGSVVVPAGYQQDVPPTRALGDIARLARLQPGRIDLRLYRKSDAARGMWRLGVYLSGAGVSLSRVLPMLQCLGVEVLDERPYEIRLAGAEHWIYDFGLRAGQELLRDAVGPDLDRQLEDDGRAVPADVPRRFTEAFEAIWYGRAEADTFNELVLLAALDWRQVSVLRAYARYLRQAGFPYSPENIARVLLSHPAAARLFVQLFEAMFDPAAFDPAAFDPAHADELDAQLRAVIDRVVSLDTDRILRAILSLIRATLRTNYYVTTPGGEPPEVLSLKLEPGEIAELPKPRPRFEVFVYGPQVEGVHLRFGSVARGGLRWSDRQEDFRTEVLGLVKAQAVKNAVIVPVGAKGGFVVKQPPRPTGDAAADRAAQQAEGVASYRRFISGLLDVTDNVDLATNAVVPPARVVRRDGDDTYLVVAADKGTATFSDIANEVAGRYRFWLGDAFASGGSAGYDHKAMGITAKGAWEAVKRHFREMDIDTQTEDFTVVGVGDMSGDVFGNGMLLSRHIKLVAAFDHRHIFVDPDPDAAASFAERQRMFALPRSSWDDYDRTRISPGGGVWDRTVKSIPISPQMRSALGLADDVTTLAPPELVRAILLAPADLLWNGGIGTYIKASAESNAEVGDKSNDAVRVDGNQLRVKVIGEGGNLGATARGRIEFCLAGGRMNTDALDNSAGVDCSDHEVNIKVLLDRLVSAGQLDAEQRNPLLASMTDEVARLVLQDNIAQNDLIGIERSNALSMLAVHGRLITNLVATRGLDLELEALPGPEEITRRGAAGGGLTSPELANLLAHVKLALKDDLLAGDLPDAPVFARRLPEYFPSELRGRFAGAIADHPLHREITTTVLVNDMVDLGGISYAFRLFEETGVSTGDAVRAFAAAVEIFDLRALWAQIRDADAPTSIRDELELETKRTLDRTSRWLLTHRPQPLAVGAEIQRYAGRASWLGSDVPGWVCGGQLQRMQQRIDEVVSRGAPRALAEQVFLLLNKFPLLDVIDIADITDRDAAEVGALYYLLDDHLGVDRLLVAVTKLKRGDRWHALARLALRDDLYASLRSLTIDVLAAGEPGQPAGAVIAEWESSNRSRLSRARTALDEIFATGSVDLATLSVAARQVRSMVSGSRGAEGSW